MRSKVQEAQEHVEVWAVGKLGICTFKAEVRVCQSLGCWALTPEQQQRGFFCLLRGSQGLRCDSVGSLEPLQ